MTNLSVICPTYRNPQCLDLFLKSATENAVLPGTEIVVIIDGFREESEHIMKKYADAKNIAWLTLEKNYGMQYAINHGVHYASNEAILVVNDDNVFGTEYDRILMERVFNPNSIFTINQIERAPGIFNFNVHDFGGPDDFRYETFLAYEKEIRKDLFTPDGNIFPFLMAKRWFMVVNGFDTLYDSPNVCDLDFFLKLELCGFLLVRSHHLHFYHFGSVATKKNKEKENFTAREQRAHATFQLKWGFPAQYGVNNSKIPPVNIINGIRFR